ncbi:isoprenylcysteine carboxylmethyltransferase family protein [Skermania sp. ID1734]|uniref:methyltransferase family protein n=1 Tax=Skermania sp. ID1734 TaxID=2597516 RepID=UPI00117FBF51|nr:isoprenylcysteine carboxylmethyltransferase family protein [Skermania sp. ID1734]TSD93660.1 isoprenylcysteine carboxylmethyltransferase family protein [Skermania sp. ID1734]
MTIHLAYTTTLVVWLGAEVVLQTVQFLRGERASTREWGSLGAIVITAVAAGIVAGVIRKHFPGLDFSLSRPVYVVLLVVAWAGIGFRLWAIISLGRYFRGIVHIQQGHRVVRSGPYRVLRHPSYAGLLVALIALAVTFANIGSIVAYVACISIGVLYRIRVEERVLLVGLGDEYARYMQETRRLIPGVW